MPSKQNANASFDVDIQRMPSECNRRTIGGSSSTEKKKNIKNIKIKKPLSPPAAEWTRTTNSPIDQPERVNQLRHGGLYKQAT